MQSECSCCQPSKHGEFEVELKCLSGEKFSIIVGTATACGCRSCVEGAEESKSSILKAKTLDVSKVKRSSSKKVKSVTKEDEEGNSKTKTVSKEKTASSKVDKSKSLTGYKTKEDAGSKAMDGGSSKVRVSDLSLEKNFESKKKKVVTKQDADGNIRVSSSKELKSGQKLKNMKEKKNLDDKKRKQKSPGEKKNEKKTNQKEKDKN